MASGSDFVLKLIDRVTAPARAMSRALAGMRDAQKSVTQASSVATAAIIRVGDAAAATGIKATQAAAGMGALARATRMAKQASSMGKFIDTKYTKSGVSGASSALKGPAMQGPILNRAAQNLSFGDRASLAVKPLMDWNRGAGEAIAKWGEMRAAFAGTPFGMVAGGLASIAMFVGRLIVGLAEAAAKAAALSLALGGLVALGITKMVVEMGAFEERSKRAFTFLTGSKAMGAEAFESGRKLAQDFNLDVEETVQQLIKLRAMQFSMPEAIELTKLSTDLQAISGDAEAAKRALTAITQIKAKGRLQSEELVGQLAEAGVSTVLVYEQLEKSLGKSRKEVLTALQNGAIDADTGIAAIKKAILHKLGTEEAGAAGKAFAQQTLTGMWQGLTNAPKQLALDISKFVNLDPVRESVGRIMELFKSVNSASVGDFVNSMISGLSKGIDVVIAFAQGFGEGFDDIRKVMGISLDTKGIQEFARTAGRWFADFFTKAIGWGKALYLTFQDLQPLFKLLWEGAKALGAGLIGAFAPLLNTIMDTYNMLSKLYDFIDSKKAKPAAPKGPPGLPIDPRLQQGRGPLVVSTPLGGTSDTGQWVGAGSPHRRTIPGRIQPPVQVNRIEINVASKDDADSVGKAVKQGAMEALDQFGSRSLGTAI